MERFAQYLDSAEDLVFAALLKAERLRQVAVYCFVIAAFAIVQLTGVMLALKSPPLALGIVALLLVGGLFFAAVRRPLASRPFVP